MLSLPKEEFRQEKDSTGRIRILCTNLIFPLIFIFSGKNQKKEVWLYFFFGRQQEKRGRFKRFRFGKINNIFLVFINICAVIR
jgi:hypothetical protein